MEQLILSFIYQLLYLYIWEQRLVQQSTTDRYHLVKQIFSITWEPTTHIKIHHATSQA